MDELEKKKAVTARLFREYDIDGRGELLAAQMQSLHEEIRLGGISLAQVKASMEYCCLMDDCCEPTELFDLLQEMDRRYFLVQDLRWEFALLDGKQKDLISEDQSRFLFEVVHGNLFSQRRWEKLLKSRPIPGTGVSFAEIEVDLCNIPSRETLAQEQLEEQSEQEERQRMYNAKQLTEEQRRREFEEEKRRLEEEKIQRKKEDEERNKEEQERLQREREEEQRKREEEVKGKQEALERKEEEQRENTMGEKKTERVRQLEIIEVQQALEAQRELERKAEALKEEEEHKDAEKSQNVEEEEAARAAELERVAEEEAKKAQEALKLAKNADERRAAEEAEKTAKERAKRERHERIRKDLKVAIKKKDKDLITKSVTEFKAAKLADTDGDLKKAETILKRFKAKDDLVKAIEVRTLESLEKAIGAVKKNGLEAYMPQEMATANKMLLGLKRLKRLKDEILNLKQRTVAEIRSYGKPLPQVQKVMTATYLLLGNKESELKDWKKMQALIGKTGSEGLKRRVMEIDPNKIPIETARKVKNILSAFDLEQVRDVSAGTAVFFAWSSATQEDVLERDKQKAEGVATTELKGRKKIKTEIASGSLTITI